MKVTVFANGKAHSYKAERLEVIEPHPKREYGAYVTPANDLLRVRVPYRTVSRGWWRLSDLVGGETLAAFREWDRYEVLS